MDIQIHDLGWLQYSLAAMAFIFGSVLVLSITSIRIRRLKTDIQITFRCVFCRKPKQGDKQVGRQAGSPSMDDPATERRDRG